MSYERYRQHFDSIATEVPFHDPLYGFNHELKDEWLSHYNSALRTSDHQGAYEHADAVFFQILNQENFEDWILKVAKYLIKRPKSEKTQKPKTQYFGCQLITLTLPKDMTKDDGKKYLTDYIREYFMGHVSEKTQSKSKKPKKPKKKIECAFCFETGESDNLHVHIFSYHPEYQLSTNNSPLKAFKYNANVQTAKTILQAENYYDYVLKLGKSGEKGEIHPNPELRKNIKKYFYLKNN